MPGRTTCAPRKSSRRTSLWIICDHMRSHHDVCFGAGNGAHAQLGSSSALCQNRQGLGGNRHLTFPWWQLYSLGMRGVGRHRLLLAALFAAVLALLVPGRASAHPGHDHGAQSRTADPIAHTAATLKLAAPDIRVAYANTFARAGTAKLVNGTGPQKSAACLGGCCRGASSTCCAALPPSPEVPEQPQRGTHVDFAVLRRAGITPGTLPEPPNALV